MSVICLLQVLSSTNGDQLNDELVNDRPNPQTVAQTDVEIVEETKYAIYLKVLLW